MIYDELENLNYYAGAGERLGVIFQYLKDNPLETLKDGRHDLEQGVYCVVGDFDVQEHGAFEAHRRYADMHLIIRGGEVMEWAPLHDLSGAGAYDESKDIQLFECAPKRMIPLPLTAGVFAILYPQDAHKPLIRLQSDTSRKVIFKIPV